MDRRRGVEPTLLDLPLGRQFERESFIVCNVSASQLKEPTIVGFFRHSVFVRRSLLALALVAAAISNSVQAAEKVALLSIKPSDKLFADVQYLLEATGTQAIGQFFLPQIKAYLGGIDGQRPIGMVLSVEGTEFMPLAFVPVKDFRAVLAQLEQQLGKPVDAGNGVLELQGPQPIYAKEQAGWAFFAQSPEALQELPANPASLLDGMEKNYDVAIRAFVKNIPAPFKEAAIGQLARRP